VLRPIDSKKESEPRSIYSAPEASVIYGGAVNMTLTHYLLTSNRIGICRTPEWVCLRARDMAD